MTEQLTNPHAQECLQALLRVWFDFERRLNRVPIIQRLEQGTFNRDDYLALLLNLRQQVIEGSRWITRSASSFDRHYSDIRSLVIGHAKDEHQDYQLLEQDFVIAGGNLELIQNGERNIGSEALHGFLMYRASRPNPVDMIGAMWMIEGLGEKMANNWAERIGELIPTNTTATKFLSYHGHNDDAHMQKFYQMLNSVCTDDSRAAAIEKTAQVVARLYCLQLEVIDE
jgi:3-oxoacyl-[acyl-carrier-protein] synthase-3